MFSSLPCRVRLVALRATDVFAPLPRYPPHLYDIRLSRRVTDGGNLHTRTRKRTARHLAVTPWPKPRPHFGTFRSTLKPRRSVFANTVKRDTQMHFDGQETSTERVHNEDAVSPLCNSPESEHFTAFNCQERGFHKALIFKRSICKTPTSRNDCTGELCMIP